MTYPDLLPIVPLASLPMVTVQAPGSKSVTNRALILAALTSKGGDPCCLEGVLHCEDTQVMVDSLRRLGFTIQEDTEGRPVLRIQSPRGDIIPKDSAELFVANSGTSMRFLTALVCLGRGKYRLDGVPRMRQRPIEDLLEGLRRLGAKARSETGDGCPPVVVEARGLDGGHVVIKGDVSSQFLSGLMMVAPFARDDVLIEVDGPLVSRPYVDMTARMMLQFQMDVELEHDNCFSIPRKGDGQLLHYTIEPDASAASYFFAAAAITGGRVMVDDLTADSLQGDVRFVELLRQMGCQVLHGQDGITVQGGPLHGIDADMNDISDTVMTLAAVACFAEGPTTIRNVAHIRHKETDRLAALSQELRRLGADVTEYPDGLKIVPAPLKGGRVETYHDHRMAMSLTLIGLRVPGVVIANPGCVAKTYPGFFEDLEKLR